MNSNESNPNVPQEDWLADLLAPGAEAAKDVDRSALAPASTEPARLVTAIEPKPRTSEASPSSLPAFHPEADRSSPAVATAALAVSAAAAAPTDRPTGAGSGAVSARLKWRWVAPFVLGAATTFAGETGVRQLWNPNFLRFGAAADVSKAQPPADTGTAATTNVPPSSGTSATSGVAATPSTTTASNAAATSSTAAANTVPATSPGSQTAGAVASSQARPPAGSTPTSTGVTSNPTIDDLLFYFHKPASSLPPPRPSP